MLRDTGDLVSTSKMKLSSVLKIIVNFWGLWVFCQGQLTENYSTELSPTSSGVVFFSRNGNVWSVNGHSSLDELFRVPVPSGCEGWTPTSRLPHPTVSYANLLPPASMPLFWLPQEELRVALHINILFYKIIKFYSITCTRSLNSNMLYASRFFDTCANTQLHAINIQTGRFASLEKGWCLVPSASILCSQTSCSCPHSVPVPCFQLESQGSLKGSLTSTQGLNLHLHWPGHQMELVMKNASTSSLIQV